MIEKFLEAMKKGTEYTFLYNNYQDMSKEEMKEILGWYMYAVSYASRVPKNDCSFEEDVREQIINELEGMV